MSESSTITAPTGAVGADAGIRSIPIEISGAALAHPLVGDLRTFLRGLH